jgi:hypothetical protein
MSNKRSRDVSFSPSPDSPSADEDSDITDERSGKVSAVDVTQEDSTGTIAMQCSLPPHTRALTFGSIAAFEVHYQKEHSHRCSSCDRNFPTDHFLALHIDEMHNPLRAELESHGEKTYACFVEDCEKVCSTPQKRRMHLIDKHCFPKSYNFRVVEYGIDKRTSMLQGPAHRRRVSTASTSHDAVSKRRRSSSNQALVGNTEHGPQPVRDGKPTRAPGSIRAGSSQTDETTEEPMDELVDSLSALQFVPPSVRRRYAGSSNPS